MNNVPTEPELKPHSGPPTVNINLTHGLNQHQVAVPANSTFGDLKSIIAQKLGFKPEMHKLLFRGKEREDDDDLQTSGVKDNSKVLIVEDTTCGQKSLEEVEDNSKVLILEDTTCGPKSPEEVKETSVISQGCEEVALIRGEVDILSEQVSALQAVVDGGTKVDDKDNVYLTEMLMRQLLKLDNIVAEGEGRVQRKMEVRRIQSLMEIMDILKSKNSNSPCNVDNSDSVAIGPLETSEPGGGSVSTSSQIPSSTPTLEAISTPESSATPIPVEFPPDSTPSSTPTPAPAQLSAPPPTTRKGNL